MILGLCCDKSTVVASTKINKYQRSNIYYPQDSYYSYHILPPEWMEAFLSEEKKLDYIFLSESICQKKDIYMSSLSRKESSPIIGINTKPSATLLRSVLETTKEKVEDYILEIKNSKSRIATTACTSLEWKASKITRRINSVQASRVQSIPECKIIERPSSSIHFQKENFSRRTSLKSDQIKEETKKKKKKKIKKIGIIKSPKMFLMFSPYANQINPTNKFLCLKPKKKGKCKKKKIIII